MGIHRDTVSRLLETNGGEAPAFKRKEWTSLLRGPYIPVIETWLKTDETAPPKQRHTAKRILGRLVEEYQFPGSYRRVQEVVAELRQKPKEVFCLWASNLERWHKSIGLKICVS